MTVDGARIKPHAERRSVSTVEYADGRRVISVWPTIGADRSRSRALKAFPVFGRTGGLKLRVQFAGEQAAAFRPTVRVPALGSRRVAGQPEPQSLTTV